jgi:hypothetical protein
MKEKFNEAIITFNEQNEQYLALKKAYTCKLKDLDKKLYIQSLNDVRFDFCAYSTKAIRENAINNKIKSLYV